MKLFLWIHSAYEKIRSHNKTVAETMRWWKWFTASDRGVPIADIDSLRVRDDITTPKRERQLSLHPIIYKNPEIIALLQRIPLYIDRDSHDVGDLVKLRNNALAMISVIGGRKFPLFISPYRTDLSSLIGKLDIIRDHQLLIDAKWPLQNDPRFRDKLQRIFVNLGIQPDTSANVDPRACFRDPAGGLVLKYYQRLVSTYIVYGPYRGVLVVHSMGTGKTCTAIAAIDHFLAFRKLEEETHNDANPVDYQRKTDSLTGVVSYPLGSALRDGKPPLLGDEVADPAVVGGRGAGTREIRQPPKVYVVLPPRANLEQNFRSELARCPSKIKEMIDAQKMKGSTTTKTHSEQTLAMINRIINQNVVIISYVSLAHRLKKQVMSLNDSLLIFDEAHNFLEPPAQYASDYRFLYDAVTKTENCKIMLLTGTPIYKSVTDLPRLLNLLKKPSETKFPEKDIDFFAKYFNGNTIKADKFAADIRGYISYFDAENDLSYFAKKIELVPVITHVSDDHYRRWMESRASEDRAYDFGADVPSAEYLATKGKGKFKSPVSGYYKRSSATTNTPLAFRKHDKWPDKFAAVAEEISKYPDEKHFVFSRHTAQGANALGEYLEEELGWDRMSNNKSDHGTNPPKYFNELSRQLMTLETKKGSLDPKQFKREKDSLIRSGVKKPGKGFVVANKATSQKEISLDKLLFNDTEDNVTGKLCNVFIVDETFSEGLSLLNTMHVHLLDPPYSRQGYRQIIARAVRNCSHKQIPFEKWRVLIHTYVSALDESHGMTDDLLIQYSKEAQIILQQIIDNVVNGSLEAGMKTVDLADPRNAKLAVWKRLIDIIRHPFKAAPKSPAPPSTTAPK